MNKIDLETRKATEGQYVSVGTARNGKELVAYRLDIETSGYYSSDTESGVETVSSKETLEGIAFLEDYVSFFEEPGSIPIPELVRRRDFKSFYMAVKPEFLEKLCQVGFRTGRYGEDQGVYNKDLWVKDPHSALARGEDVRVVEAYYPGHQVFDLAGVPYATMGVFSYVGMCMENRSYDLEALVKILVERDDILLFENGGEGPSWQKPSGKDDKDPSKWIGGIPSYNCFDGQTRCVLFHWKPRREDYIKAYNEALTKHTWPGSDDIKRGAFRLDILGIAETRTETGQDYLHL